MTSEEFATKFCASVMRDEIIDCENDITAMIEVLRVKRNELYELKRRLHAIENPGEPYVDTDLF